jgi:hypothetical protein
MISSMMTADDLHQLFLEAAQTEAWMPAAKQRARASFWPEMSAEWLSYADPETRVRLTPSSEQIDRYDLAITLSLTLEDRDRQLIWAVAYSAVNRVKPHYARIAKQRHVDRRTIKRQYMAALVALSHRLEN